MSSATMGTPSAKVWQWSAAHWLVSLPSRSDQVSRTQPEPPARALPMAANSLRQRSTEPKALKRTCQAVCGFAGAAQGFEVDLVQQHRVGRDQPLAAKPV